MRIPASRWRLPCERVLRQGRYRPIDIDRSPEGRDNTRRAGDVNPPVTVRASAWECRVADA
ncbi:MAG: hypothetical protein ACKOEO_00745, partial [Planctomycetaceae bacterium]